MTHGKLANDSHLVEVLFELRYDSEVSTNDAVEKFYHSLQKDYPDRETLETQFVQFEIRPEGGWRTSTSENVKDDPLDVIRYRFKSVEKNHICQVGNGILSVNFLEYEGFDIFAQEVSRIVQIHQDIFSPRGYRRLGLRYMNHFPFSAELKPIELLSWSARVPTSLDQESVVVSNIQQTLLGMGKLGFQNIVVAYPQTNQIQQSIILLDIENFLQFQQSVEPSLQALDVWIQEVHNKVWDAFKGALDPEFFKELKGDDDTKPNVKA